MSPESCPGWIVIFNQVNVTIEARVLQ